MVTSIQIFASERFVQCCLGLNLMEGSGVIPLFVEECCHQQEKTGGIKISSIGDDAKGEEHQSV